MIEGIYIRHEGNQVVVDIAAGGKISGSVARFTRPSINELDAVLIERELEAELQDLMINIRKRAYMEGWKDAKAKRKKRTLFWACTFDCRY